MAKVFVSYSRKDIEFAKRLTAELKKCELDFWIDWEGIPPTVDWWREIEKGIEEADVFLFLISPDSSASKVCGQEIDTAVKNAKRIIPLVVRDIKGDEAPKQLSHLNWIFFRQSDDFEAAFQKLLTGIHTDYEWVQQHRWLQVRALDWQRDNKDNSSLLRGKDLQDVEFQLATNLSKEPHPTDLQREYVFASRKAVDRQRRVVTSISVTGFVVMALLTVAALIQLNLSRAQQLGFQAQVALADNNANSAMLYAYQSNMIHENKAASRVLSQVAYKNFPLAKAIYTGSAQINDAAWSPKGKLALAFEDGTVALWEGNQNEQPRFLRIHTDSVYSVAWSPTGQLASGSADHQVIIWDPNTGKPAKILKSDPASIYSSVAWLENGQLLSVSQAGELVTWDISAGKPAKTLTLQGFGGRASWSPDGKLASTSGSNVILWDLNTGLPAQILKGHSTLVNQLAWSPDGQLASASNDYTIIIWNLNTGQPAQTLKGHTFMVHGLAWSPDGQLASASWDKTVIIWNLKTGQPAQVLKGHSAFVNYVAWSPDSQLASFSSDNTMILWDRTSAQAAILDSPSAATSLAWSPDGTLASGSFDGSVIIWDIETGQPAKTLRVHTGYVRGIAWSPNGKLASTSDTQHQDSLLKGGQLIIWDPGTGKAVQILTTPSLISSLAWSPNGLLASGGDDGSVIIWNLVTGQPAKTLRTSSPVRSIAWSALGKLVSGSSDGSVIIWNLETNQPEQILKGHKGSVTSVAWSPNGQLASGSEDDANGSYGTVIVWNFSTGKPAQTLKAPSGVTSVAWSSSGKLASASGETVTDSVSLAGTSGLADSEVTIWNLDTGQPGQTLKGQFGKINGIAWSPDGQLASISWDRTIKIARKDLLNNDVCKIIFRNMKLEEWLSTEGTFYTYQPACPNLHDPSIDIGANEIFPELFSELENMRFPEIIAKAITYGVAATVAPIVIWLDPSAIDLSINPMDLLLITWKGRIILLITYFVLITFLFFIFRAFFKSASWVWQKIRKPKARLTFEIEPASPDQQQI